MSAARDDAAERIAGGIGRYAVIHEADGTYTVVDKLAKSLHTRYIAWHVTHNKAWQVAIDYEIRGGC